MYDIKKWLILTFQRLTECVLYFTPVGVFFLVAEQVVKMTSDRNATTIATFLAYYVGTVLFGLLLHGLVILPGLYCKYLLTKLLTAAALLLQLYV